MLLAPRRDERRLDPMMKRLQSVDAGVAGGAERDQKPRLVDAGPSVVDGQFPAGPTAAAAAAIAGEDLLAISGETAPGTRLPAKAAGTQAGREEAVLPAGTE
jgi:hypothetical protein